MTVFDYKPTISMRDSNFTSNLDNLLDAFDEIDLYLTRSVFSAQKHSGQELVFSVTSNMDNSVQISLHTATIKAKPF